MKEYQITVLKGDGIGPEIVDQAIKVLNKTAEKFDFKVNYQEEYIGGAAIDATGEPLIGVNITVIGGTEGTITDIDGNYTIGVPAGAKLKFSYIGYKDQIIDVAAQTVINVKLQEDSEVLDEVVVVGYGTMKKSDLNASIVSVKSEKLNKAASPNFSEMLMGRAAGLTVKSYDPQSV